MRAQLILWFAHSEGLLKFVEMYLKAEPSFKMEIYSASSYRMAYVNDVTALTHESGQLRFNVGRGGFTLDAHSILRHEVKFYEAETE